MPTTSTSSTTTPSFSLGTSDLIIDRLASIDCKIKLKAFRKVKKKIIDNQTKKLAYIKLGVVPVIAFVLAKADTNFDSGANLIVQSTAVLGSFSCGIEAGLRVVLDADTRANLKFRPSKQICRSEAIERGAAKARAGVEFQTK